MSWLLGLLYPNMFSLKSQIAAIVFLDFLNCSFPQWSTGSEVSGLKASILQ